MTVPVAEAISIGGLVRFVLPTYAYGLCLWFKFFVEAYFCIGVFQSIVLLQNFRAELDQESVKKFWSGSGVEKLATLQHSNLKTFQAKATLRL